jgi:tRNA(Ile)-lysidine synthetase-like protein
MAAPSLEHISPSDHVLIAISGGPDSTALLLALHESGYRVTAAHFDHALRDGSGQVAQQVAELCARIGVPLISERRAVAMPKGSVQAAARKLRYDFLDRARMEAGADVVAIAHTADDVVEGVVLHLLRGCGLAGLRGMPARRAHNVRPWLGVWRSEVHAYLAERGVTAHQDPANEDTKYARVRVRQQILPALERDRPGITRRFHAAAMQASRLHDAVSHSAAAALARETLGRKEIRSMQATTAVETLRLIYARAGGSEPGLSRIHLDSMLNLTEPGRGGRGVDLPGGLRFRIVGDLVQITPAQHLGATSPRLEVRSCAGCDDRHAAHLRAGLALRVGYRQPGLRMRPAGGRGTRKLQDIFVDARVPREDRDSWPLVFAGERLAWVPGLAVDADLAAARGETSQHVAIIPMPNASGGKVARLEPPESPPGELI